MQKTGSIYLIPTPLGEEGISTIPTQVLELTHTLDTFIVERAKTARRFLKQAKTPVHFNDMTFFELNKHTATEELDSFLQPAVEGKDIGLLSEAGVPGVADPGAEIVTLAHHKNIKIIPLVGPSSILLALMASGLNGQNFAFMGYLPVKTPVRSKEIKKQEQHAKNTKQTKIFIETPYRNEALFTDFLQYLSPDTHLCIAVDLTLETEEIHTYPIHKWKKLPKPDLHKRPAVFLFGVPSIQHYRKRK